ncbi:MAG TPA: fluoride efflux transporter CrcB [Paludibacter sp.]|nr:fluoride efflux transporter CrcB [Paludibacter sp.]
MKQLLFIGLGGFIGSILRYLVSKLNLSVHFLSIPVGTLSVNIIGSLVIGFIAGIAMKSEIISPDLRLFLMVGVCGGFTTFSSFSLENMMLLQNGQYFTALIYTLSSVIFSIMAVYLGYIISNIL